MRISLEVDDGRHPTPPDGDDPARSASPISGETGAGADDLDAGPWAGEPDPTAATSGSFAAHGAAPEAADPHTSLSSPEADDADGDTGAEAAPAAGEPTQPAAEPNGDLETVEGYELPDTAQETALTVAIDEQLRDISEASFGAPPEPVAEAVIGTDDRVQIGATNVYPWRVHCSLRITAADGSQWIGTGWFCGPHTVITAGHCVYIKNSGVAGRDGWVRSITVIPGRNGAAQPFGAVISSNLRTVTGWANSANHEYDYGAVILSQNLGNSTGWLGFGAYSDATLRSSTANISGYPGDKPAGTQWYHARRITAVSQRKVYYDVDTFGGQSGSAVYRIANGGRYAVAVHAYGGATSNSGTRITSGVFNNLVAWRA